MLPRLAPMRLNNGLNEKKRKTNRTISTKGIHKCTSINKNIIQMGYRKDIVTCYPKQHVIELGLLTRVKPWFITPSDSSSTKKCHDIINRRSLSVWICRSTNNRYMRSFKHYLFSYPKFFTSNPSSQVMTTEIIRMSREIQIEFSNQSS